MSCCAMLSFAVEDQMCIPLAFLFISLLTLNYYNASSALIRVAFSSIPNHPRSHSRLASAPPLSASASEEFVYAFECDLVFSLFSFF